MSRYPEKSELPPLLVPRQDYRFPLDNLVERPWIEPFTWGVRGGRGVGDPFGPPGMAQCNRVQRPPPPPHLIAQSKKSLHNQTISRSDDSNIASAIDPNVRVKQVEKSLAFVKESHSLILNSLQKEVEELKNKNRELQFQIIVGLNSPDSVDPSAKPTKDEQSVELQKKIDKLEKEIRRLRNALRESLQVNTDLSAQLEALKLKHIPGGLSDTMEDLPPRSHSALDLSKDTRPSTPGSGSPKIDEYSDSLHLIQQAASARTKSSRPAMEIRRYDRQYNGGSSSRNSDWGPHGERGRRYSDYQPRLPRLALRNQQNFQQQNADSLPLLKKPLFPSLEQSERARKPRGQRARPVGNIPQR